MVNASWLASTAAKFKTRITAVPPTGAGIRQVLDANPMRYFVQFRVATGAANFPFVWPGVPYDGFTGNLDNGSPLEWKYRDAPSIVTGEHYWFDDGLTTLLIVECLYVGG